MVDIHTMVYYLGIKINEQQIYSTTWMNLTDMILVKNKPDTKVHKCECIYMMFRNAQLIYESRNKKTLLLG